MWTTKILSTAPQNMLRLLEKPVRAKKAVLKSWHSDTYVGKPYCINNTKTKMSEYFSSLMTPH